MTTNDYVNYAYLRVNRKTQKKLQALILGKNKTYDDIITRCVNIAAPVIYKEIQEEATKELQRQLNQEEKVLA